MPTVAYDRVKLVSAPNVGSATKGLNNMRITTFVTRIGDFWSRYQKIFLFFTFCISSILLFICIKRFFVIIDLLSQLWNLSDRVDYEWRTLKIDACLITLVILFLDILAFAVVIFMNIHYLISKLYDLFLKFIKVDTKDWYNYKVYYKRLEETIANDYLNALGAALGWFVLVIACHIGFDFQDTQNKVFFLKTFPQEFVEQTYQKAMAINEWAKELRPSITPKIIVIECGKPPWLSFRWSLLLNRFNIEAKTQEEVGSVLLFQYRRSSYGTKYRKYSPGLERPHIAYYLQISLILVDLNKKQIVASGNWATSWADPPLDVAEHEKKESGEAEVFGAAGNWLENILSVICPTQHP